MPEEVPGNTPARNGIIRVRPVLFCAPVFFTPDFWVQSVHALDWVRPETPLDEKPWVELEVSLDVTLGEVFDAACEAWGIRPGADLHEHGGSLRDQFHRFAFVRADQDASGVSEQVGYRWPPELAIARVDGSVVRVHGTEVTYRELLVSSSLGLIEGDVTRPYVHPVLPQGDFGLVTPELFELSVEAIQAAYDALSSGAVHTVRLIRGWAPEVHEAAGKVWEEGERYVWYIALFEWLRRMLRRLRRRLRRRHND